MIVSKSARRAKSVPAVLSQPMLSLDLPCLQQAEICREQARDAARLKRFGAAFGLFATAAALCRHALSVPEGDETARSVATERLRQIDLEIATYAEFARSSSRAKC